MTEFELKFQVPAHQRASLEAALANGGRLRRQRLRARYFDTPTQALARSGVVLRLRQEGRHWVQTAKAAGASAFDRLEDNVSLGVGAAPGLDVHRHAGSAAGHRLAQALAESGESAADLALTFATDVVRLSRTLEAGRASIEAALDTGSIETAGRRQPVCEVEFELKQGSAAGLADAVVPWCVAHDLWLDPLSKGEAGLRLAFEQGAGPPRLAGTSPRKPTGGAAWLGAALWAGIEQALWNAREIAAGPHEAEHVHQLRVALRRLRVLLGELRDLEVLGPARAELPAIESLFRQLGEHRDRTVLLPRQLARMQAAGAPSLALPTDLPDIGAAVRAMAVQVAWLRLVEVQQALRDGERDAPSAAALQARLVARLARLHRKAFRQGRRFDSLDEARRHAVRKQFKRLRYLAELARPLFAGRRVDRYVAELKSVQDALGRYQDACTGRLHWTGDANDAPTAWFAVGWLAGQEQLEAAACTAACRAAARAAKPFWG